MAKHEWTHDHIIDFTNSIVIESGSHRTRKALESWHTAVTNNADNNFMSLPRQYTMLTKKDTLYITIYHYLTIYMLALINLATPASFLCCAKPRSLSSAISLNIESALTDEEGGHTFLKCCNVIVAYKLRMRVKC